MGKPLGWSLAIRKMRVRVWSYLLEFVTGFLWYVVGSVPSHTIRNFFYKTAGVRLGKGSTLHMFCRMYDPTHISIGNGTIIGDQVVLDGRSALRIGNHVDIASRVMIFNSEHDVHADDFGPIEAEVVIDDYVFIGPNAIILPGVHIGKGAVVGAGAVVTKDIAPLSIVGGVPAKEIMKRKTRELAYRLGRHRLFQ
ncbi:MAG: acyltransferase [Candidatus Pacebacteria bacterium]|nr:acyltransferase [Candidatus Paceibacterota bacterium]